MKKKTKSIITGCVIAVVVASVLVMLWVKFMPGEKLSSLVSEESEIGEVLCVYPVKVQGDSMAPTLTDGSLVNFNKCFEKENLPDETIIVYKDRSLMRMGRIREKIDGESGIYYKVSPEARVEDIRDVFPDAIVAIYDE